MVADKLRGSTEKIRKKKKIVILTGGMWVVCRESSGGTIGRLDLGCATTTLVTVTRRAFAGPPTTRPPHRNH
ncbi:hypothetical protein Y032_0015g2536 [Ancylostoma ceylanicum]|uniref:Uncharacterized protein n=1 Tax=Ancylostoma ceylanicum TaxID=53326 RepID=A0A016V710_9BILA|nr:hypothetical protein Y032_0015g2536 [Ancylostoma ceylanicum]